LLQQLFDQVGGAGHDALLVKNERGFYHEGRLWESVGIRRLYAKCLQRFIAALSGKHWRVLNDSDLTC
jgi:hypothetical protein